MNPAAGSEPTPDARQHAPATLRNRDFILPILQRLLPAQGLVLEIAAGSGEHACYFAAQLPGCRWQPTDMDEAALASIEAWRSAAALPNLLPARALDVAAADWPVALADALVCINMIHYSPWDSTPALFAGAARVLAPGGVVYCYGPYMRDGRHTAPSNESFDDWLKARDPRFGVRDLAEVEAAAAAHGLRLDEVIEMPANNFSLVFRRA
ncbi:hypothetical protein dqs_3839 [Azoarcus olearius]|uniref:DUF938 domain-containing protein n=1 Tax=Azoarcus sp. (strain BH72) TaxID=418699 RepID=UPI00080631CA|nr:DUF938 domain-containing protein [Azoarcus olearius]ANQ86856.1 hypothetical protein dqs_3839 [Azoarcus olearius]